MAKKNKAAKVATGTTTVRRVEYIPAADVPTYYTNNVNVDLTTFDVRLRLGQIHNATPEGLLTINENARVFMSHQHFRALVKVMNETLLKLEQMPAMVFRGEDQKTH